MVVSQINVKSVSVLKAEYHAIISPDGYCVKIFQVTFQSMQPKTRKIHILKCAGTVQDGQNVLKLLDEVGANAFPLSIRKKAFQSLMPEAPYHAILIQ